MLRFLVGTGAVFRPWHAAFFIFLASVDPQYCANLSWSYGATAVLVTASSLQTTALDFACVVEHLHWVRIADPSVLGSLFDMWPAQVSWARCLK